VHTIEDQDGITIIERFQRGGLVAYSIDEGETYHPTVRQAFEHQAEQQANNTGGEDGTTTT
jgi:hypothetical protein